MNHHEYQARSWLINQLIIVLIYLNSLQAQRLQERSLVAVLAIKIHRSCEQWKQSIIPFFIFEQSTAHYFCMTIINNQVQSFHCSLCRHCTRILCIQPVDTHTQKHINKNTSTHRAEPGQLGNQQNCFFWGGGNMLLKRISPQTLSPHQD